MRKIGLLAGAFLLAASTFGAAHADMPGRHPYYIHALSDLRGARWLVEHRSGDMAVSEHESIAIHEIEMAINEVRHAAIDDGKDIHDHSGMDGGGDYHGRLFRARDVLRRARNDIAREEDDPMARGLQHRALQHIDEALHQIDGAIWDVEHHR